MIINKIYINVLAVKGTPHIHMIMVAKRRDENYYHKLYDFSRTYPDHGIKPFGRYGKGD